MVTFSPYSKSLLNTVKQKPHGDSAGDTDNSGKYSGDGSIVMHSTSLDVDVSVRISDLIKRISDLENKTLLLETMLGIYTTENQEPEPVDPPFIIGIWKFDIDGNDLILSVDYNLGLSVRAWVEKVRFTINEEYP